MSRKDDIENGKTTSLVLLAELGDELRSFIENSPAVLTESNSPEYN